MIRVVSGENLVEILKRREFSVPPKVRETVSSIIEDVRKRGDRALIDYAAGINHARIDSIELCPEEIRETYERIAKEDARFIEILGKSAENIRAFHSAQLREGFELRTSDGARIGQKIIPLEKVGVYVPGGAAPLSSTVLMDIIPARIAGVGEILMASAPMEDGRINPYIVAAAYAAGADRIFKCGGAQAIAALALGTETIPKVMKIVGPGSIYVAEAKRQIFGVTGIDMIAGPSEILILADDAADPDIAAADMLAQAEHDVEASAILLTDSMSFAEKVRAAIEKRLPVLPREYIAGTSIENHGYIAIVRDMDEGMDISNRIAPEHLELMTDEAERLLQKVRNAGSVFVGRYSPEALGDYYAGPNHTLPTGGAAGYSSPLSVDDFVKKTQYICYTEEAFEKAADDIAYFAEKEALHGHALSVLARKGAK